MFTFPPIQWLHFPPQKSHNSPYNFHISPPCFNSDSPFPQPAVHQGQRHTWLKYWAKIYTNRPNIPVRGCFLIRQNKQSHLAEINFKFSDQKKKIDLVGVKAWVLDVFERANEGWPRGCKIGRNGCADPPPRGPASQDQSTRKLTQLLWSLGKFPRGKLP